jgi:hypothetical protein
MEAELLQFGYFYCGFYVEAICVKCGRVVARASTREELKPQEEAHVCDSADATVASDT